MQQALLRDARQCAVCTNTTTYTCVNPKAHIEGIDIDSRPYELSIIALPYWVQQCGTCRHCGVDVRTIHPDARAIVKTTAYLAILNDTGYPFLAREYLAAAHLCRMTERYAEAGWHALRAAWKCEDMLHPMAGFCRTNALQAFELALQHAQSVGANAFESALIIGDVWRRNGDNAAAARFCQQAQLMAEHASQRVVAQQLSDAIATSQRGRIQRAVITN
jgi:hypothetical protein